jgi:hypothetical protein
MHALVVELGVEVLVAPGGAIGWGSARRDREGKRGETSRTELVNVSIPQSV